MNLTGFREAVATALESIPEVAAGDWMVLPEPTDAVQPPCFTIVWGPDPGGVTETVCSDLAQLEVLVVAARLTPEGNYPLIEGMIDTALDALAGARLRPYQWLVPAPTEIGQITYLAARLQLRQPVSRNGGT